MQSFLADSQYKDLNCAPVDETEGKFWARVSLGAGR